MEAQEVISSATTLLPVHTAQDSAHKPRRNSACEEELAEPTFAQVVINLGEAIVNQKREEGAEIKGNKVVYIPACPQLR